MSKPPDRRLLRQPFSINQSSHNSRAAFPEQRQFLGKFPGSSKRAPAEGARQRPYVPPDPSQDQEPYSPSALTQRATSQKSSSPWSSPATRYPGYHAQKSKKLDLLLRQKWRKIVLAVVLFLPSFFIPYELSSAYVIYHLAQDGINHLQAVANVFHGTSKNGGFTTYFDGTKLQQVQANIDAAHADFVSLNEKLAQDSTIGLASSFLPTQINTLRALGSIAVDGTAIAQQALKTLRDLAPTISSAIQNASLNTDPPVLPPYLTPASYQEVDATVHAITPLVHRITIEAQGVSLSSLPISSKQKATIASILPLLPVADGFLAQWSTLRDPLGWLLGIGQPRSFLVEPMDASELRATGGFTGQFGELAIDGAHVGPLKLSNIGKYEEDHTNEGSPPIYAVYNKVSEQFAPKPYDWWPIANFGMRDANVSGGFPTSAQLIMHQYSYEFDRNVDGVIIFTPTLIKYVLHVTGPIPIPLYHQVVTEQNLETLLHYYQLDNAGIYQEQQIEHQSDSGLARKLFTQRVTTALISTATHLPIDKMLALAIEMLHALKTKDFQAYFTNPQVEALVGKYGSTAAMDRSTTHDGLFIVQENLSANKASQYVTTSINDSITLDNQGGATHHLQLTLDYQQKGGVYGPSTYRDYVRVYAPETSQFISGDGFEQFAAGYCGDAQSGYRLCKSDVYGALGDHSLTCTLPLAKDVGLANAGYLYDPYDGYDHPLDRIGPPPNQKSDEVGRAMFGGWVVVPANCTMKVTLSWYVPPMGGQPYSFMLQGQASVYGPLDLTIQPAAGTCGQQNGNPLHFSKKMDGSDTLFTIKNQGSQCTLVSS